MISNQLLKYFPHLTEQQQEQFNRLPELYAFWNDQINVVSRKDIESLGERHVLHSLGIAKVMEFSPGKNVMCNRSRTVFAYSARFKRWTTKRPGLLLLSAARSSDAASQLVNPAYSASEGRGMPGGGIARTLNFRRTRSQVPECATRSSKLAASRLTGASDGDEERLL